MIRPVPPTLPRRSDVDVRQPMKHRGPIAGSAQRGRDEIGESTEEGGGTTIRPLTNYGECV
jgi:hypothetical protein